jgi:pulcherriminic acid synthase
MAGSGVVRNVVFDLPGLSFPSTGTAPRCDAPGLVREVCEWSHDNGLVGARGRERMETSGILDVGLALSGGGPRERALLLMQWFVWRRSHSGRSVCCEASTWTATPRAIRC